MKIKQNSFGNLIQCQFVFASSSHLLPLAARLHDETKTCGHACLGDALLFRCLPSHARVLLLNLTWLVGQVSLFFFDLNPKPT